MRLRRAFVVASAVVVGLGAVTPVHARVGLPRSTRALAGARTTLGGKPCRFVQTQVALPLGPAPAGGCLGVRPGALIQTRLAGVGDILCSLNFLFRGSDGHRYIGTAGHCALEAGSKVFPGDSGAIVKDRAGKRIGRFAYGINADPRDFALIRLDDGVSANPSMCQFGGPTGINSDLSSVPVVLEHYGNGETVSSVVPARSAVALGMPSMDHVYAMGLVVPGDSGSGIISSDGRAVGVVVTTGLHLGSIGIPTDVGLMGVTRLAPQLAGAQHALGITLTLVTAPLN